MLIIKTRTFVLATLFMGLMIPHLSAKTCQECRAEKEACENAPHKAFSKCNPPYELCMQSCT